MKAHAKHEMTILCSLFLSWGTEKTIYICLVSALYHFLQAYRCPIGIFHTASDDTGFVEWLLHVSTFSSTVDEITTDASNCILIGC